MAEAAPDSANKAKPEKSPVFFKLKSQEREG